VALPYLRAADLYWQGESPSYPVAVVRAYEQAIEQARLKFGSGVPLVALGHMHASGGQVSEESERKLVIGGEEAVALGSLASKLSYFALGHLHLAQEVGGLKHVRYSGSPLPMSFSEINYPHQVILVDLPPSGDASIQSVPVPRSVELLRCPKEPGNLDVVVQALRALNLAQCEHEQRPFLEVPVYIDGPTPEMRARIEDALKNIPVRLGRILVSRSAQASANPIQEPLMGLENLRTIDPFLVFTKIHEREYGTAPAEELSRLFAEVVRDVNAGVES
jgi:exonuclease SbcD